jgi:hypothetical protein
MTAIDGQHGIVWNSRIAASVSITSGIGWTSLAPQRQAFFTLIEFAPMFASWKKGALQVGHISGAMP